MATSTQIINGPLIYILAFSALLFFINIFLMIFFLVRYRRSKHPVAQELKNSWLLEAAWVIVPTFFVITMFIYGLTSFSFLRKAPPDSIVIKVNARQWSWLFIYGNGKKSPDLVIPAGKDIKLVLTSADVIHGFYVPAFRIQQDTVPGIKTEVWFNATTLGNYDIYCAQYCGLKHSSMLAKLYVTSQDQYESWLKGGKVQFSGKIETAQMIPGQNLLIERGCISCHTFEGQSALGPTFKGLYGSRVKVITNGVVHDVTADDTYIRDSIVTPGKDIVAGYRNSMPSGRDVLSDSEIKKIIEYLKTIK